MDGISKAIYCLGSQAKLAQAIGTTQTAISQFASGSKRPSAETAIRVEMATRGMVRAEEIRPDIPWHVIRGKRKAA